MLDILLILLNYFTFSEGVDGEEFRNYKSTGAYNYFHNNKVGHVLFCQNGDYSFLKAEVELSQSVSQPRCIAKEDRDISSCGSCR